MNDTMNSKNEVSKLDDIMSKLSPDERAFVSGLIDKDPLTGLYNRRKFDQDIELVVSMSGRGNKGSGLLFIDIDHFKKFNDEYGHHTGDVVLKETAQVIKGCIRDIDIVARWGGEEFIVLLPETRKDEALGVASRIREMIAGHSFSQIERQITVSIGLAGVPDPSIDTAEKLIHSADLVMYEAKSKGRNRIEIYE